MHKTLFITKSIHEQLISHAKKELPNECCGYISGSGSELKTVIEMTNVDASSVHFSFDPKEQFQAVKEARKRDEALIVAYHSHPESPPRLSNEDLRLLTDPNMVYLIISLENNQELIKAYHIIDENITEVEIIIKESEYV